MDSDETIRNQGDQAPQSDRGCAEDGVDVTLIRWMLSLTPTERLQVLQQHIQSIRELLDENCRS